MDLMNIVFKYFLDTFVIVFIDNILIYSRTDAEHETHLRRVLLSVCCQYAYRLYAKYSRRILVAGSDLIETYYVRT